MAATRVRAKEAGVEPPPIPPVAIYDDMGALPFTFADRDAITGWLRRVLNPAGLAPSPDRQVSQKYSIFLPSFVPGNDANLNLALRRISEQYPQAAEQSPVATTRAYLGAPNIAATRQRGGMQKGLIQLRPELIPQDTDAPPVWRDKMHDLMATLAHELSHGMGMPDEGAPDAYDVSRAYGRLHGDIHLPTERPAPAAAKRKR